MEGGLLKAAFFFSQTNILEQSVGSIIFHPVNSQLDLYPFIQQFLYYFFDVDRLVSAERFLGIT